MQKLWVEWSLSPVRSQWQIHFAVLTLAARWIFCSMMRLGYVTYNVYLHDSSDTENISLKFSFLKIRCPSYTFNFTFYFFFLHTSYKGELRLLSSWMFFFLKEKFSTYIETWTKVQITLSTKFLNYQQTKENVVLLQEQNFFLPIHLLFLWTKATGKSVREVVLFALKKTNSDEMRNPPKKQKCSVKEVWYDKNLSIKFLQIFPSCSL